MAATAKAQWSGAYINDLPDSSFLYIEPGGKKDGEGKTTPRSLRHFPVKDKDGKVDPAHVRNALSRIPQSSLSQGIKDKATAAAQRMLDNANKRLELVKNDAPTSPIAAELARRAAEAKTRRAAPPGLRKDDMTSGDAAPATAAPEVGTESPPQGPKRVSFRGIPVVVDRPRGYVQSGTGPDGKTWRRVYHVDYGYIPETKGGDGQGLDVFLGGDEGSNDAHWILQRKLDGSFDEYKVMLGFPDPKNARSMYEAHVPKKFFGSMATMPLEMMKALLGIEPAASIGKVLEGLRAIVESAGVDAIEKRLGDAYGWVEKIIKHESDGWHVYAEDGKKHLGGPYKTKGEAVERLRQVEGHKKAVGDDGPADDCAPEALALIEQGLCMLTGLPVSIGLDSEPALDEANEELAAGDLVINALTAAAGAPSAKAVDAKVRRLLENFGPPNEWSGAVAAIAGPERRKAMKEAWAAMSAEERAAVERKFEENFAKGMAKGGVKLAVSKDAGAGELRYVVGIVLEPEVVDAQGDIYSADEIRAAAWSYMTNFRNIGLMHKGLLNGKANLVESYIAPVDMDVEGSTIRKGTWVLGIHVLDDETWGQVKNGSLTGLSIGGFAKRTPAG